MSKEKFEVTILGCGAAVPKDPHMTTSQLVNIHEKQFLIDCGEGTQTQLWKMPVRITNLNHIFISHAHGDHFFGLVPLLSSMRLMLGRSEDIHVYIPEDMEPLLKQVLEAYCKTPFSVIIHTHDGKARTVLYEDDELSIETIPLKHSVPCSGFLFREKPKAPVLDVERCRELGISVREFQRIKNGGDYVAPDGTVVKNSELTYPSPFVPRSYAFCSDTAYFQEAVLQLQDVDLLYHEATYLAADEQQAIESAHSTTLQAALMAYEANVGKLLLGHYSVRYSNDERFAQEARTIFPNCIACKEGMRIDVEHISDEEKDKNLLQKVAMPVMEEEIKKPEPQIKVAGGLHIDWQKGEVVGSDPDIVEAIIPFGITAIKAVAFKNRLYLRRVVIPESVCDIGKSAFQGCAALSSVEMYASVSELRDSTFKDCSSLMKMEIPEGVTELGRWCFRGCQFLQSVVLPSTLQKIGVAAFQECVSLEAIDLPASLLSIKLNAFLGCSSLGNMKIPSNCLVFEGNTTK
jgi:ribonuclease Z